jgi:RNA polymerase sigma-70 factor (ECF subfamily)
VGVGIASTQPVESSVVAGVSGLPDATGPNEIWHAEFWHAEFWQASGAGAYGLGREEFDRLLLRIGTAQNYGQPEGVAASPQQQASFFRGLRLADLVLARACAAGHEGAWEHFLALYRQPLERAAIAITASETLGRELAGQLYAQLYGLTTRDGERRSPLESYRGRGSLIGWLRTTLAQRHVDHHRRTRREFPLDDTPEGCEPTAAVPEPETPPAELLLLAKAIEQAIERRPAEERLLLAAYYIDGRTQVEIGRLLQVHEATVSRKLRRVTGELRKQVVRNLRGLGLSRQAAREALGADPRDLDLNLKKMLQISPPDPFPEKAAR